MAFVAVLIIFPVAWTGYLSLTDAEGSVRAEPPSSSASRTTSTCSPTPTGSGRRSAARCSFTGVALFFEVILGMAIALLLWRPFRGEKWVRVAILLPLVATPVAVGMMWRLIFDPNIGMANQLLGWIGIPPNPGWPGSTPPCRPRSSSTSGSGRRWSC